MARRSKIVASGGRHFQLKLYPDQLQYLYEMLNILPAKSIEGPISTLKDKIRRELKVDPGFLGFHVLLLSQGEASDLRRWYKVIDEGSIPEVIEGGTDIVGYKDITEEYKLENPDKPIFPGDKVISIPTKEFVQDLVKSRNPNLSPRIIESLLENSPSKIGH